MVGVTLMQNHRDPIVSDLINYYEEAKENGLKLGTSGNSRK